MKVAQVILSLLILAIVPNVVYVFYAGPYPYFAYMVLIGEFAGVFSLMYHMVLIQPGMLFWKIPAWLESWAYARTLGQPLTAINVKDLMSFKPDTRQKEYDELIWALKPYRECSECLAGQLGVLGAILSWFTYGFHFWSLLAIPSIAILVTAYLGRTWKQLNP